MGFFSSRQNVLPGSIDSHLKGQKENGSVASPLKQLTFTMQHNPICSKQHKGLDIVVVVALLFYVHGKHLRSCRDGQLT